MSGEGHKDWLSGLQFHPRGSHLATAAGDGTVKLWDFASASCVATYTDHTQPVWSVDFHHSGVSLWLVGNIFVRSLKKTFLLTSAWRNVLLPPHPPPYQLTTQQDFIASSSMDHTAKLWDVNSQRCRQTSQGTRPLEPGDGTHHLVGTPLGLHSHPRSYRHGPQWLWLSPTGVRWCSGATAHMKAMAGLRRSWHLARCWQQLAAAGAQCPRQ